ncbi:MAG: hypothetical protein RRB22_11085 [Gammaproteobacteria bacterium]|nr:hypothetical protein [Gammaproteobacteria bacterium]
MFGIKKYFIGMVLGLVVGLWFGVNLGQDRPLWSNPFAERALTDKAKDTVVDAFKDARKAARDSLAD